MKRVYALMQRAVDDGVFPGGVLLIRYRGEVIFHEAFGWASLIPDRTPMTVETLFDIASLTKAVATTTAAMLLRERGKISLDDRVTDWIPEFRGNGKEGIVIAHLLTHSSGLVVVVRPCELVPDPSAIDRQETKRLIFEEIYRSSLAYPTGSETRYSDPGFILMGEIVERASGERLDRFCQREVFVPPGMDSSRFLPLDDGVAPERCAATEDCPWRGRVIRGEVHDETSYLMGGVAGHAGLFSTADDLGRFVGEILATHAGATCRFLRPATVRAWTARAGIVEGSSRACGWDTPSEGSSSGTHLSPLAFGHTGFTGTSVWVDPAPDLGVILLTNRVHPSRENVRILKFRPQLHNLIAETLQRST